MQRAGPSPLALAHVLAILAVLAALFPGCAMSWFVAAFACFDTCSTPDYYFAQLAPREALFMLPCVALAALAVAVFVLHCLDTHQPGRALFVFLFFLVGGLLGAAALYGLAQVALAVLSNSDNPYVNQQAADWMRVGHSPSCSSPSRGRGPWRPCNGMPNGARNRNSVGSG
jgi:hypothetical protein